MDEERQTEPRGGHAAHRDLLFGRFEPLHELGSGGFGRVLLCHDSETRRQVAVKVLHRFSGDALLRFKSEFRLLQDVTHPNLVRLGELFEAEGVWAFSLEYVPGTDFLSWVRPDGQRLDEPRLRAALLSLAQGLVALHAFGLLHRDVKPANVRVTPEGRVVLLDFGLVAQLGASGDPDDWGQGTVAYMAPEQALPGLVGPEADFYALGALLYESLTGRLPFEGTAHQILLRKQREQPPAPSLLAPGLPRDLEELCLGLMLADPRARRVGSEVLEVLGAPSTPAPTESLSPPSSEIFIGRAAEMARLYECFEHSRRRGLELVLIEGESGIGKSALMARFGAELESGAHALVLGGRCHPAEQVPYKAFDGAVDQLLRYVKRLDEAGTKAWLPDNAELLPALFSSFHGVPTIAKAARHAAASSAPDRFVLFQTFARLLARVAQLRPLALHIDDLQWSDMESLLLLEHLLEAREPAHLLVVATIRPLAAAVSELDQKLARLRTLANVTRVELGPLPGDEARMLGAALLDRSEDDTLVKRLGAESSGHPLFLAELARGSTSSVPPTSERSLQDVIMQRVARLSATARRALDVLALEAAPTPRAVLAAALDADPNELAEALATLRAGRLLGLVQRTAFVCYHDRIRETLIAGLDAEQQRRWHRRLAEAWQGLERVDPARVARHWLGAHESAEALPWLERAASEADAKAAYEHAADLYRSLLAQPALAEGARGRVERALGDVLSRAGRFELAASAYERALESASSDEKAGLFVRMAEHLLQAGRVQAGLDAAQRACEAAGLSWPGSTGATLARLAWHRAMLGLTRLDRERSARAISAEEARQLDVLWRLGHTMLWADAVRGVELNARHLRLALATGEPRHIALGLHLESISMALQGTSGLETVQEAALRWSVRVDSAEVRAFTPFAIGAAAILRGRIGLESLRESERICLEQCPGEAWLLTNNRSVALGQLYQLSMYPELAKQGRQWLDEAQHRGDRVLFAGLVVQGGGAVLHLISDRPDLALALIDEAMAPWRGQSFGVQHLAEVVARSVVHMYEGGGALSAYWAETWPRVKNTLLGRAGQSAEVMRLFRTLGAIDSAFVGGPTPDAAALRTARELARGLRNTRSPQSRGLAAMLFAQLAYVSGDGDEARRQAQLALELRLGPSALPNSFADLIIAALDGPSAYRERERSALDWLSQAGVVNPERMLRGWFPILPALRSGRAPRA